ncbi:MAG: 2'-5' RNA ligase family protein [Arcticibacter sp.]
MPETSLFEYLLVIPLDDPVLSEIEDLKAKYKAEQTSTASITSPHITLANVVQPLSIEGILINMYKRVAAGMSPFSVQLSGFGRFTGPTNTIFVNVHNGEQISDFVKYIRRSSKPILQRGGGYSPVYSLTPHLTIARGISEAEFKEAWPSWQTRAYDATSFVSKMRLLKRQISSISNSYAFVADFPFQSLGHQYTQLKLFGDGF